ncbi:unnamed protein product [Schistosoma curassoni]|uniref:Uncharacterized protein n=1 Tax=Schistosoma curassoni TaxID=6186 RepID=A0A183JBY0_9TREM|nr:unnamed protein product [Schistosoma curassoni]
MMINSIINSGMITVIMYKMSINTTIILQIICTWCNHSCHYCSGSCYNICNCTSYW